MSAAWKRGGDLAQKRGTDSWRRAQDSANALGTESARCPWRNGDNPSIRPSVAGTRGRWLQFKETASRPPFDPNIFGVGKIKGPVAGRL